jgi:hypothetical protein
MAFCAVTELVAAVMAALLRGTLVAFVALLVWGCP